MDSYYDVQIKSGPTTVGGGQQYYGPARQFGSGAAGLGALAVRVGRSTLPLLYKYALPVVKRVGRNLVTAAIPELREVLKGRKKLKQAVKSTVKSGVSKSINQTIQKAANRGGARAAGGRGGRSAAGGGARNGSNQNKLSPPLMIRKRASSNNNSFPISISSKRSKLNNSSSRRSRSRQDILANVKYIA